MSVNGIRVFEPIRDVNLIKWLNLYIARDKLTKQDRINWFDLIHSFVLPACYRHHSSRKWCFDDVEIIAKQLHWLCGQIIATQILGES